MPSGGLPGNDGASPRIRLREEPEAGQADAPTAPLAIYIDLVPDPHPGDALARHLGDHGDRYFRVTRLRHTGHKLIPPEASTTW